MLSYLRRNASLLIGITLLAILAIFMIVGAFTIDTSNAQPLSVPALQPPSWDYPFGTDRQGRDLLAVMVAGTPLTLWVGFVAGIIGVGVGSILAFTAAYYGGIVDTLIRSIADIGLTIPGLLVLIIIAVSLKGSLTVNQMAIVVASLAWLNPTRTIRSQVLTLRERGYVEIARLNGMSGPEIICTRADAQPAAIPLRHAGRQHLRRDPGLGGIGISWPGTCQFADARHDTLLGAVQRGHHQRLVVVVDGAARRHRDGLPRSVLFDRRTGRNSQSKITPSSMMDAPANVPTNSPAHPPGNTPVLRVEGLRVAYDHARGAVRAVDDVSFALRPHERFGLAGESGSGKSTMALAILRMIKPPGRIEGGEVWLEDTALSRLTPDVIRRLRLAGIAMVPQGSMNSLNPVVRIRDQIGDALADHGAKLSRRDLAARVRGSARRCGIAAGNRRQISARTFRWHEAARLHRHRDLPAAEGDHR